MKHIIGQHTDQAPANKLMRWLKDWARNNLGLVDKKKGVVGTSAKADGSAFRAALLSGPPGIGKTTTATLVCEALGLRYFELNASVARSKKMLDQKVSELIHSRRVDEYFGANKGEGKPAIKAKNGMKVTHVLIMDEVDGMSGNQDRSGVSIQIYNNSTNII
jgi:replication factor C subunit 1